MAEVKWIKITTNMFEDEKINYIESLPECDAIITIWMKLLTLAGKNNMNGFIFLTQSIPYTDEMLSHKFRRPLNTVKLALETLRRLEMILYDDNGFLKITHWEKHQNIEGLEKIREQNRIRKQRQREREKLLSAPPERDSHGMVTGHHATELELDIDIDIDKDLCACIPFKQIVDYLNNTAGRSYKHQTAKTRELISARWNEGYQLEDFKIVINNKASDSQIKRKDGTLVFDPRYLRPETLFGNKFESYLNQPAPRKAGQVEDEDDLRSKFGRKL